MNDQFPLMPDEAPTEVNMSKLFKFSGSAPCPFHPGFKRNSVSSKQKHHFQRQKLNGPTIQHVLLTTGHVRINSPLSAATLQFIEFFQDWLKNGKVAWHPDLGNSLIQTLPDDHFAVVSAQRDTLNCSVLDPNGKKIVTLVANLGDFESQTAWRHLHELQTIQGVNLPARKPPAGSWCGVVIHQLRPKYGSYSWLADFERFLSCAWFTLGVEDREKFRIRLGNPKICSVHRGN